MANFTWTPKKTTPRKPNYAVHQTATENYKKESLLVDSTPLLQFELSIPNADQATRNAIAAHYAGQYGPHASFTWATVPAFIDGGASMTVRYAEYAEKPHSIKKWDLRIVLEKVN